MHFRTRLLNSKEVGALAGLAPVPNVSGERRGVRVIWGGRAAVRRILYLAALTAQARNNDMRTIYRHLIAVLRP